MRKTTYVYLDLIRALAAILVLLSHSRNFLLVDYDAVRFTKGPVVKALYFLSGYGHLSVIIFFVLSGFLISSSVAEAERRKSWTWPNYALHRLTRLMVVLVPCLFLTLLLDCIALSTTHSPFYAGAPDFSFGSGPPQTGVALDFRTFIGNLMFLQTLFVPVLGSNGPLWSLANEFWYYVLFPLCYLAWKRRTRKLEALVYAALAGVIATRVMSAGMLSLFFVWLAGYLAYLFVGTPAGRRVARHPLALPATASAFIMDAVVCRSDLLPAPIADFVFAAAFLPLMIVLVDKPAGEGFAVRAGQRVAAMSFTLYLMHFPILAVIHSTVFKDVRFQPNLEGISLWISTVAFVFALCFLLFFAFEAHTSAVRRTIGNFSARRSKANVPLRTT